MRNALAKKDKHSEIKPKQKKPRKIRTPKAPKKDTKTPSPLVISDSVECDAWLVFLLNDGPSKTLMGRRGHVPETEFWEDLREVVFPQKQNRTAAEILQCILIYHFGS